MKPEKKATNVKEKSKKVSKKKGNSTLIIGVVAVIILIGAAYAVLSGGGPQTGDDKKATTGMTLKELRAQVDAEYAKKGYTGTNTPPVRDDYTPVLSPRKADNLPDYIYTNAMTLKAYQYATEHPEVLEQMACYCGCGQHGSEASDGKAHRFLRDCFINDRGEYDSHASTCDVCIGIALKAANNFPSGLSGPGAATGKSPQVQSTIQSTDLSSLSLPNNFKSLSDGLKLIPPGIKWAYFANLKQGTGIEQNAVPDSNFYGTQIIGMLNSEYSNGSWIELHDVGKSDANVKSNGGNDADNILYVRPYIFATKDKTNSVLAIMKDGSGNATAYNSFNSILEKVDDENAGFAKINATAPPFADASYVGFVKSDNDVKGEIAFRIKNNEAIPLAKYNELKDSSASRGFKSYEVQKDNNTLVIRMTTANLNSIISEAAQNYGVMI